VGDILARSNMPSGLNALLGEVRGQRAIAVNMGRDDAVMGRTYKLVRGRKINDPEAAERSLQHKAIMADASLAGFQRLRSLHGPRPLRRRKATA